MFATIALLVLFSIPSNSRTAWMTPDAFHLAMGMKKANVVKRLKSDGWRPEGGKNGDLIIKYDDRRTVTMGFAGERLASLRFELVDFLPEVKLAAAERESFLSTKYGRGRKMPGETTVLAYDSVLPNIHLVVSTDRTSSFGIQGLGFVVVRYFVPAIR
jgi:hypothetical protein